MSDAGYEVRIRSYVHAPRVTHRIMLIGKHIGDWWSDGVITVTRTDPDAFMPHGSEHAIARWADDGGPA